MNTINSRVSTAARGALSTVYGFVLDNVLGFGLTVITNYMMPAPKTPYYLCAADREPQPGEPPIGYPSYRPLSITTVEQAGPLPVFLVPSLHSVNLLSCNPDGSVMYVAHNNMIVELTMPGSKATLDTPLADTTNGAVAGTGQAAIVRMLDAGSSGTILQVRCGVWGGVKVVAALDNSGDIVVFSVDSPTAHPIRRHRIAGAAVGVCFSGDRMYVSGEREIECFLFNPPADSPDNDVPFSAQSSGVTPCVDVSPDGRYMAAATSAGLTVYDGTTGRTVAFSGTRERGWSCRWIARRSVRALRQLSPDGTAGAVPAASAGAGEYLILYTTQHHLYLFDSNLKTLAYAEHAVKMRIALAAEYERLNRLSILEYIPELSVVLVGSQAGCRVGVVRIVCLVDTAGARTYSFVVEQYLPASAPLFDEAVPVVGLCVNRIASQTRGPLAVLDRTAFRMSLLLHNGCVHAYELTRDRPFSLSAVVL